MIATPNAPTRAWSAADDEYLQNIVELRGRTDRAREHQVVLAGGTLAGRHDVESLAAHRLLQEQGRWLAEPVGRTAWRTTGHACRFGNVTPALQLPRRRAAAACAGDRRAGRGVDRASDRRLLVYLRQPVEREIDAKGVPPASAWAAKYGCGARGAAKEIVDTKAGYIYDRSRQNPPNPSWGLLPGPGTAHVMTYAGCKDGRVVADVVRIDKGHTEGLEPNDHRRARRLDAVREGRQAAANRSGRR